MVTKEAEPGFVWAVPSELAIPPDPLRCRLDFHHQATVLTLFSGETAQRKINPGKGTSNRSG